MASKWWTNERVLEALVGRFITCTSDLAIIAQPSITKVDWSCTICKHAWKTTVDSVINLKSGCPLCAGNLPHTNKSIQILLNRRKDNLVIEYLHNGSQHSERKITLKCLNCTHVFQNTLSNVIGKSQGCGICNRSLGAMGQRWLDRNSNLDMNSKLYVIEFSNDTEHFIKVGITKQPIRTRFGLKKYKTYNLVVLLEQPCTVKEAWNIEEQLLHKFVAFSYTPKHSTFSGKTECFTLTMRNQIVNRAKNLLKATNAN